MVISASAPTETNPFHRNSKEGLGTNQQWMDQHNITRGPFWESGRLKGMTMSWKLLGPLALLGSVLISPSHSQDTDKAAVPSASDQAEAEKFIKELFKDDYAKRTPADKITLAKKMLGQAIQTKDDPRAQFVLFREARDLCTQAGDVLTGMLAIDEMSKRFAVDPAAMKNTLLTLATKTAKTPEDFKGLAIVNLRRVEPLVTADDYEAAEKLVATVIAQATRTKDVSLLNRAAAKAKEIANLKAKYDKVK